MREIRQSFTEDDFQPKPEVPAIPVMEESKPVKKSKASKFILIPAIVIGVLVWSAIGYFYFTAIRRGIDPKIMAGVTMINKACPITVNERIQMESMTLIDNKTMLCVYTLKTVEATMITDTTAAKEQVIESANKQMGANPITATLKGQGVTYYYQYRDKNGKYIFTAEIKADEMK